MNSVAIHRLVVDELNKSLHGRVQLESILTRGEIRNLQLIESRVDTLCEVISPGLVKDLGIMVLKSRMGRKALIALLKAVRFIVDIPKMAIMKIAPPIWNKALNFLKTKGINMPFTGEEIVDFLSSFAPERLLSLGLTGAISFLDDMSDADYLGMIGEEPEEKKEPGSEKALPKSKRELPSPKPDGAPEPSVAERRFRSHRR